jgi:hypothetical protein
MSAHHGSNSRPRRERVVHKARNHEEAAAWDREQHLRMTPDERRRAARVLKERAYPPDAPDVRACREHE